VFHPLVQLKTGCEIHVRSRERHSSLKRAVDGNTLREISGLMADRARRMVTLSGSTRPLSAASTNPARVSFSDGGAALIVTERYALPRLVRRRPDKRRAFFGLGCGAVIVVAAAES